MFFKCISFQLWTYWVSYTNFRWYLLVQDFTPSPSQHLQVQWIEVTVLNWFSKSATKIWFGRKMLARCSGKMWFFYSRRGRRVRCDGRIWQVHTYRSWVVCLFLWIRLMPFTCDDLGGSSPSKCLQKKLAYSSIWFLYFGEHIKWYQHRPQTVQVNQLNQIALSTTLFLGFFLHSILLYFQSKLLFFESILV